MKTTSGMPRIPERGREGSGRRGSILEAAGEEQRRGRESRSNGLLGLQETRYGERCFEFAVHRGGIGQASRAVRR